MSSPSQARRRQLRTWRPNPNGSGLLPVHATDQGDEKPRCLVDLASNDYLNLAQHPELIAAATEEIKRSGVGAGGSRLVSGSRPVHDQLEHQLAQWLNRDRVLLYPSGFQANLAAVLALADRRTPVLADRLCHHSLLTGVQASGARLQRFAHNDLIDLNRKLERCQDRHPGQQPLVITESLFSMEGTSPNLSAMAELCSSHAARLLVDEAHALGVLGDGGRGLSHALPHKAVTMLSGTFGKAFGSGGAFLACAIPIGRKRCRPRRNPAPNQWRLSLHHSVSTIPCRSSSCSINADATPSPLVGRADGNQPTVALRSRCRWMDPSRRSRSDSPPRDRFRPSSS